MTLLSRIIRIMVVIAVVIGGVANTPAYAQTIDMRAGIHEGFGRLVFEWAEPTQFTARISGARLIVSFASPVTGDPSRLVSRLPDYISAVRREDQGRRLVFNLRGQYQLRPRAFGTSVILDLTRVGPAPTQKPTVKKAKAVSIPRVPVRVGTHKTYTRVVFDWPKRSNYTLRNANGRTQIRFSSPGHVNVATVRRALPQALKSFRVENTNPLVVSLPSAAQPKHFRAGKSKNSVVVDIPLIAVTTAKPLSLPTAKVAKSSKEPPKPKAKPVVKVETAPLEPHVDAAEEQDAELAPSIADGAESGVVGAPASVGRVVSLSFSWDQPTGAAVFRRAGYIWAVFDRPHSVDVKLMRRMGRGVLLDVEQVPMSGGTAVRILAPKSYNPSLRREGLLWIVDIMAQSLYPKTPIRISPEKIKTGGIKWALPTNEGGSVLQVMDPGVGDSMTVVPVVPLGHGIAKARRTVDMIMPVTAQGIVVIPRIDDVEVTSNRNGVEISRKGGLHLSDESATSAALASTDEISIVDRAFDMATWVQGGDDEFIQDRLALREAVMTASEDRKGIARLDLARFFFAHGYAAEALGVLRTIAADNPSRQEQPDFLALRGAANYLMHRSDEAVRDLSNETLLGSVEAQFWNALARLEAGNKKAQGEDVLTIRAAAPLLKDYPERLRTRLALNAAEILANVGDNTGVQNYLDIAKREHHSIQEEAEIDYLKGRMHASSGALDAAIADWEQAEDTFVRPFRARAAFDRIMLQREMGTISVDEAIDGLDRLRFAWRGDGFEYKLLKTLSDMNLNAKRYAEGLRVLRQMVSYFADSPELKGITEEMRTTFRELFLKDRAAELSPVRAIGLFEEFRELTPPGKDGDEMIRKLADRLVSVDLLSQAAQLLEHQVNSRLKGAERSRVGARLALVYLLDRKPSLALAALKKSPYAENTKKLREQRNQLRGRALADLGQGKNALKVLSADNSDESNLLKAEIEWRAKNWAGAAEALSSAVRPPEDGAQMSEEMRKRVLQWATALRLSDNRREIALLRRNYLRHMRATAQFDAFNLLTNQTASGLIDMKTVEAQIKQAESFRSFMGDFKDRMKSDGLSAIN